MTELKQIRKKYKGEWLAFLVKKINRTGEELGQLIAHHKDKKQLHQILRQKKIKDVYITFAGRIFKPGYAVMFLWK